MKKITLYSLIVFVVCLGAYNTVFADDFYYTGAPQYNPYNGYTVMSLPPPPPMSQVPFYVRDDYDDYLEDYYECILGYEYEGMTCRYWRKYAEKNGFYQKGQPVNTQTGNINTNNTNTVNNMNNTNTGNNVVNNSQPVQTQQHNTAPANNANIPYTPKHN